MSDVFKPGDAVQAVDHVGIASPIAGHVTEVAGVYIKVRYDNNPHARDDIYYRESGWRAWDGETRWRLHHADR